MEEEIIHIWEHALGVFYPGDLDVELILSASPALLVEQQTGGIGIEIEKEGDSSIVFLEESSTGNIEFVMDNNHNIDITIDGTIIYHPTNTYLPQVKIYLENPNDLIEIYLGTKKLSELLSKVNITGEQILTILKQVDGDASGLDADTLDGEHKSYFAPINSPSFQGNVTVAGTVLATNHRLSSDRRLKTKIKPIPGTPITVEYKQFEFISEPGVIRYGVIAQELQEKHPELVHEHAGFLSVSALDLVFREIANLKARIIELEGRQN